ncbi:MAG: glycosyl hydrolase [Bacteroidales bacterium]
MKFRLFIIFLYFINCTAPIISQSYKKPVNPNASKEVKALLKYLYSLQGKKLLSGQHNYPGEFNRSSDSIRSFTGKYPAIWGCDLSNLDNGLVNEAIRHYKKGEIITLMYHQVKPFDHDSLGYAGSVKGMVTDEQWEKIITPGTEYYNQLIYKIDQRAEVLIKLRNSKVPVLWRPYHEMNGMWFWYGNRPGKDGIQKLWIMMYDRYVNFHKLNNLIWVWNINAPRDWKDDEAYPYELSYPGDQYVDILAADICKNDFKQSHHDQLLELGKGKLIALGEIGDIPSAEILKKQTMWSWFMIWAHFPWTHKTPEQVKGIYNMDNVHTINEIK